MKYELMIEVRKREERINELLKEVATLRKLNRLDNALIKELEKNN